MSKAIIVDIFHCAWEGQWTCALKPFEIVVYLFDDSTIDWLTTADNCWVLDENHKNALQWKRETKKTHKATVVHLVSKFRKKKSKILNWILVKRGNPVNRIICSMALLWISLSINYKLHNYHFRKTTAVRNSHHRFGTIVGKLSHAKLQVIHWAVLLTNIDQSTQNDLKLICPKLL